MKPHSNAVFNITWAGYGAYNCRKAKGSPPFHNNNNKNNNNNNNNNKNSGLISHRANKIAPRL